MPMPVSPTSTTQLVHAVALHAEGAHPHATALRREVDRVAEQVADDVRDLLAVGVQRREVALARR